MTFEACDMQRGDILACAEIINHIISLGSSTAHEDAFDEEGFADHYFEEPEVANVVLTNDRVVGFQAAFEIEPGIYSIGSFTDQQNPARGSGAALFVKTQNDCRSHGGTSIIAKITSDNVGGLTYYSKMGFQPDAILPDHFTRSDGKMVDPIVKRFKL
jgi:L-amino acid N-acyltransferase YncA